MPAAPLTQSTMPQSPPASEILDRVRNLASVVESRVREAESLRCLPESTIRDFHDAGLFRIVQPQRYGGYALSPAVLFEAQVELGAVCPSTAWVLGVLGVHSWQMALFPLEAQEEVWGEDDTTLISSSYAPTGKIERAPGGYRVSGRWSFSSGCDYARWVFLGGFVPPEGPDSRPDMRTFLLPRSDYRIDDTWHVSGLKASGSKDIVVDGAFVPEYRTHRLMDGFKQNSPGNLHHSSPIYRLPFGQIHVRSVSTPALGAALGALRHYRERTATRLAATDQSKVAEDPTPQLTCAQAAADLDTELTILRRNFQELLSAAETQQPLPLERRIQFRFESARAAGTALRVVDQLHLTSGARAIFLDNPLQRFFQDVHAIRAHYANNPEPPGRNWGRVQFGSKNQDFFI